MASTTCKRWALDTTRGIALAVTVFASGAVAEAQLDQRLFRAADGTAYQVLRADGLDAGAEKMRVTAVAGSVAGVGTCLMTGTASGDPLSAVGGTRVAQTLHPYALVARTAVLVPNDIAQLSFDSTVGGRLTLGNGRGALSVCGSQFDRRAQNVQARVGLDTAIGNVPGACIAENLSAACDATNLRGAFAFGLAATGQPPVCNDITQVTVDTSVCAATPPDGFDLGAGQAIVFVYGGSLAGMGFDVASAGFGVTTDVSPLGCGADSIVSAAVGAAGAIPVATPTNTPQGGSGTATATSTGTPLRAGGIPVVASPLSLAGLALIVLLSAALHRALRRMSPR
jgi:hypothetical protein